MKVKVITLTNKKRYIVSDIVAQRVGKKVEAGERNAIVRVGEELFKVSAVASILAEEINRADIPSALLAQLEETAGENIRNLPTEVVFMVEEREALWPTNKTQAELKKSGADYYIATCCYREEADGTKSYLTQSGDIPRLLKMHKVDDDEWAIVGIFVYGVRQF